MGSVGPEEHVAKLRRVYREWGESKGSSFKPWLDLMSDQVRLRSLGAGVPGIEFSRAAMSRADVMRYFDELSQDWEMLRYDVEQMIGQGDWVAMLGSCAWRHRRTRKVAETLKADFLRFENGRVVEFVELYDTAATLAAATPDPASADVS